MDDTKFCIFDASGMKGLNIENAQEISRGTLFRDYHTPTSYNKVQRKKTLSDQTRFTPMAPGLFHYWIKSAKALCRKRVVISWLYPYYIS